MENYHVIDLVGEGSFGKARAPLCRSSWAPARSLTTRRGTGVRRGHHTGPSLRAQVYKGRRKFTGQITAMKFIMKHGKSEKDIKNLRQEIEILRQLRHENIIQMLDAFETKTDFCVVTGARMERGPGGQTVAVHMVPSPGRRV